MDVDRSRSPHKNGGGSHPSPAFVPPPPAPDSQGSDASEHPPGAPDWSRHNSHVSGGSWNSNNNNNNGKQSSWPSNDGYHNKSSDWNNKDSYSNSGWKSRDESWKKDWKNDYKSNAGSNNSSWPPQPTTTQPGTTMDDHPGRPNAAWPPQPPIPQTPQPPAPQEAAPAWPPQPPIDAAGAAQAKSASLPQLPPLAQIGVATQPAPTPEFGSLGAMLRASQAPSPPPPTVPTMSNAQREQWPELMGTGTAPQQPRPGMPGMQPNMMGQPNFGQQMGSVASGGLTQNLSNMAPLSLSQMQQGLQQTQQQQQQSHGLLGVGQQNFQQPPQPQSHGLLGLGQSPPPRPHVVNQGSGTNPAFVGSPGFKGLGGCGARPNAGQFGKAVGQFPGMQQPTPSNGMTTAFPGQQGHMGQQYLPRPSAGGQPPPPPPPPQAGPYQPPPPPMQPVPSAEPQKAPQPTPEPVKEGESVQAAAEFGTRLDTLQKANPRIAVPPEVWVWSHTELEVFFSSGGSIRPKSIDKKSLIPRKREGKEDAQYEVSDALSIQGQLRECFAEVVFQDAMKRLHQRYPERRTKGHPDGVAFFEAFEALALSIYARVLPLWGLTADWDGVREMFLLMNDALKHPKVKKTQEEINVLMGLPRNATFTPPAKGEDLFVYRPTGDGPVPGYPRPLVADDDGDEGHEFWIEDRETGNLVAQGVEKEDAGEIWYQVCANVKAVVIRERSDEGSKMVGRKKSGKKIRVQRVIGGKWLQLHDSELARLGVQEAWVLLDGSELGMPGQQLLEKVSA